MSSWDPQGHLLSVSYRTGARPPSRLHGGVPFSPLGRRFPELGIGAVRMKRNNPEPKARRPEPYGCSQTPFLPRALARYRALSAWAMTSTAEEMPGSG
jgi:hypothetical protein